MSSRWQHRTIMIACQFDGRCEEQHVEADVLGALAVHRTAFMLWTRAKWSVTHVPTGRHIATANTERLARQFVRSVLPLTDWAACTDLGGRPAEFWNAMHAAMKRAHNGQYVSEVRIG